jgi:hypothetical protein
MVVELSFGLGVGLVVVEEDISLVGVFIVGEQLALLSEIVHMIDNSLVEVDKMWIFILKWCVLTSRFIKWQLVDDID